MKCPNCGADLDKNTKFCPKCGNAIISPMDNNLKGNSSNFDFREVINMILKKPKLLAIVGVALILILAFAVMTGGESNQGYSSNGGYITEIFGLSFHIPEGFEESYHSGPFSSGETVDYQSGDYDDLEIEVSPQYSVNLNSNHVKVKTQKTLMEWMGH